MADRPYFRFGQPQLEAVFRDAKGDKAILMELEAELCFRTKKAALALLKEVRSVLGSDIERQPLETAVAKPVRPQTTSERPAPAVGGSVPVPRGPWVYDDSQRRIVEAPSDARIIVNAPPGTGKTAVACGRIAQLLRSGVPCHQIWLLSFTRTAVHELRNRVAELAIDHADAYGVRCSTLDARAWQVIQGFEGGGGGALQAGYHATIRHAIDIFKAGGDAIEEMFDEVSHIIVDEAQDLVGERATLVELMIGLAPAACGVTILSDEAQAIYGFAEEETSGVVSEGTLTERLRTSASGAFVETSLTNVYRAASPGLKHLFVRSREGLLHKLREGQTSAPAYIREEIAKYQDGIASKPRDEHAESSELVLYRTRFEVLDESCYLSDKGGLHRIRMSGMPTCLHPWLALAFSDYASPRISRPQFETRFERVAESLGDWSPDMATAWQNMNRYAGDGTTVRLDDLRETLARPRPPIEFTLPDLGLAGPILSTIHASKGREADRVRLMLPSDDRDDQNPADEARVLFVGATRARMHLGVGKGGGSSSSTAGDSGRRCSRTRPTSSQRNRARVEVGLADDLDTLSVVSRALFEHEADALASQQWLKSACTSVGRLSAWAGLADDAFRYILRIGVESDGLAIGKFRREFNWDLFKAAEVLWRDAKLKPPYYICPLFQVGVRSVTLSPDDDRSSAIHRSWASSGFFLAPIVVGLPTLPFKPK